MPTCFVRRMGRPAAGKPMHEEVTATRKSLASQLMVGMMLLLASVGDAAGVSGIQGLPAVAAIQREPAMPAHAAPGVMPNATWVARSANGVYEYYVERERDDVKRIPVAVMVATMLMVWTVSGRSTEAQVATTGNTEVANAVAAANALCGEIPSAGYSGAAEVSGALDAGLPPILKRFQLLSGNVSGKAAVSGDAYKGAARKDLPAVLHDNLACRTDVARYILSARGAGQVPVGKATSISGASATARVGDIQQNQSVVVNGQAAHIPPFTITEEPFGFTPTYHVTPDVVSSPTTNADLAPVPKAVELIRELSRPLGDSSITYVGDSTINGHQQVGLKGLWGIDNRIQLPDRLFVTGAIWVPVQGEPVYVSLNRAIYNLTVDAPRTPDDGSPPRLVVHLVKQTGD